MDELALFARAAAPDTAASRPRRHLRVLAPLAAAACLVLGVVALAPRHATAPTHKPGVITLTHERPTGPAGTAPTSSTTIPEGVQAFDQNGNPIPSPTSPPPTPAPGTTLAPVTPTP